MKYQEIKTPCFVLKSEDLRANLNDFYKALRREFPNGIIGYSFKTNSLPRILTIVKECGCYAEVVSDTEYKLAEYAGFPLNNIIFNGPIKGKENFIRAIENGSIVNMDSKREIEWLNELSDTGKPYKIGIRVNFDLEKALPGQTSTEKEGGRFGFCVENGELHKAIQRCKEINGVEIKGLHLHVSSKSKSVDVYKTLIRQAIAIINAEGLDIEYLDVGGGFFGGGDNGESYNKYVCAIKEELAENGLADINVIVEPGASVIATAVEYVTSVVEVKETNYNRFVVTDGTRLHIDPFFRRSKHCFSIDTKSTDSKEEQVVVGYTCMEHDRFMKLVDEKELCAGDRITYHIIGSYTMCLNSLFIDYLPRVYEYNQGEYHIVREKWDVQEYVQKCKF